MKGPRERTGYRCGACGAEHLRWQGRCERCGEWSTVEEVRGAAASPGPSGPGPVPLPEVAGDAALRLPTGIGELDRVLGGGFVAGSVTLLAGDPGVGKSTLLLLAAAGLARAGRTTLYVSGEESPAQAALRARRLGVASPRILLLAETEVGEVLAHAERLRPALLAVDSIQTLRAGGAPSTLRECAEEVTRFAKRTGTAAVLVGHVTKGGDVAGPMALAHLVDAVLDFAGDRYQALRILRARKNRFGSAEETGLFTMRPDGLAEAADGPAARPDRDGAGAPGCAVVPALVGTRVLLVEVQALCVPTPQPPLRRRVAGLDPRRAEILLAALERWADLPLGKHDVFLSVAGGVAVEEPGADLATALAVASVLSGAGPPADTVAFGEIGLRGEVRPVPRARIRLAEAARLGYRRALAPPGTETAPGIETVPVADLAAALARLSPRRPP